MIPKANHHQNEVYALLSTFEQTFVFYYNEKKNILLISPQLSRNKLLKAIFFVLAINLRKTIEKTNPDLFEILNNIANDVTNVIADIVEKDENKSTHERNLRKKESKDSTNQSGKTKKMNQLRYELSFEKNSLIVGNGRTSMVYKVPIDEGWQALKMVDLFKPAAGAHQELENEANVMNWLTKKKKCKTLINKLFIKLGFFFEYY